jgi:hypothetical protein
MPDRFSPASRDRARKADQALDRARAEAGNDRNRDAADTQVPPSHGDKSLKHPNINNRRVGR